MLHTLELAAVLNALQAISSEIDPAQLFPKLLLALLEFAGAERGLLLVEQAGVTSLVAEASPRQTTLLAALPLEQSEALPITLVQHVAATRQPLLTHGEATGFAEDRYLRSHQPAGLLCAPLLAGDQLAGLYYLEFHSASALASERLALLQQLAPLAANAISHAQRYASMARQLDQLARALHLSSMEGQSAATRLEGLLKFNRFLQHELRSYTAGLSGVMPLLQELLQGEPEQLPPATLRAQLLEELGLTMTQMGELTDQLVIVMKQGRLPEQQRQPVLLSELFGHVRESTLELAAQYELPLKLAIDIPPGLFLAGDARYLSLAFCMATRNAVESLSSYVQPQPPLISVWAIRQDGLLLIRVEDNGPGFPATLLADLEAPGAEEEGFMLGWTTKSGGSGLGLPLMDRVARLHDGLLRLRNRPDQHGARLEFCFPIAPAWPDR